MGFTCVMFPITLSSVSSNSLALHNSRPHGISQCPSAIFKSRFCWVRKTKSSPSKTSDCPKIVHGHVLAAERFGHFRGATLWGGLGLHRCCLRRDVSGVAFDGAMAMYLTWTWASHVFDWFLYLYLSTWWFRNAKSWRGLGSQGALQRMGGLRCKRRLNMWGL